MPAACDGKNGPEVQGNLQASPVAPKGTFPASRSKFHVSDARRSVRSPNVNFRTDLDLAEQLHLSKEARARTRYNALMSEYQRSCADAPTHRIFLKLLVAEGRRYQEAQCKVGSRKPRLTPEVQSLLYEVFEREMQARDGYVELLADVASMRIFDVGSRASSHRLAGRQCLVAP